MMALFARELKLATRVGAGAMTGVLFFLAVVTVVPFAVGPDLNLLARIGPAVLWIGALLASLLGLDRLFQQDREDGSLAILLMSEHPSALIVFVKCLAHWAATGLPLIVAAPIFGLFLNMEAKAIAATVATLAVGTPAITFIGAVGAAVTVTLARGGLIIAILVLPLVLPSLIFGVAASYGAVEDPAPFTQPFIMLTAVTLFLAVLGPLAAGFALKHAID
ncbi:MAG: heme exporter protein CcmB [Salaquimonas sp.]|jgi:heme exporter protein B|nr:heme exporter protein CcmB [Salaquimonas sp.]